MEFRHIDINGLFPNMLHEGNIALLIYAVLIQFPKLMSDSDTPNKV